jgi:ribonucleotide monophosphatase NagD (HAD superfamily)
VQIDASVCSLSLTTRRKRGLPTATKLQPFFFSPSFSVVHAAGQFRGLGIEATEDDILSSGWAAAMKLKGDVRPVFVVGEQGLVSELELAGVRTTQDKSQLDRAVRAVVVGDDCVCVYVSKS